MDQPAPCRARPGRWLLAVAAVVVGGLLVMHGFEPPAASATHDASAVPGVGGAHHPGSHTSQAPHQHSAATGVHGGDGIGRADRADTPSLGPVDGGHGTCDGCELLGHGAMLCVAVVGSVVAARVLRRVFARLEPRIGEGRDTGGRWAEVLDRVLRPPRPVWVQLAVMRC